MHRYIFQTFQIPGLFGDKRHFQFPQASKFSGSCSRIFEVIARAWLKRFESKNDELSRGFLQDQREPDFWIGAHGIIKVEPISGVQPDPEYH
jgi:hypothetical protein